MMLLRQLKGPFRAKTALLLRLLLKQYALRLKILRMKMNKTYEKQIGEKIRALKEILKVSYDEILE